MHRSMATAAILLLASCAAAFAHPDDLRAGILVAHYVPELTFTSDPPPEGWCDAYAPYAIGGIGEINDRIDGENVPALWYVLAAWESDEKTWCGTAFGLGEFAPEAFVFVEASPCFPATGLEYSSPGWPGPSAGTSLVTTGVPWTGNWLPVYCFGGYAGTYGAQAVVPLAEDPTAGMAGFSNCVTVPEEFPLGPEQLGALGVNTPGIVPVTFPPAPEAACCLPEYRCEVLPEDDCLAGGGDWLWDVESCDPYPCPLPGFVCCFPSGGCALLPEEQQCLDLGGTWHPEWTSCDPNPCPRPAVCCIEGDCVIVYSEGECLALGGLYFPEWTSCTPNPCPHWSVCCFPDGRCEVLLFPEECTSQGGTWRPDLGASCDPNPCPQPGACCVLGECTIVYSEAQCDQLGGEFHPEWTSCDPNPCPPARYVCCLPDGTCLLLETQLECELLGGAWIPSLHSCEPNPCPQPKVCCVFSECVIVYALSQCTSLGGEYHPEWRSCDPNPCPQGAFVCCFPNGACLVVWGPACEQAGGDWRPDLGRSCDPNPCPQPRVCCFIDGSCLLFLEGDCHQAGGVWHPEWDECKPNPCEPVYVVCCVDGECHLLIGNQQAQCAQMGGSWHPEWRTCEPNPCIDGVCCLGEYCFVIPIDDCLAQYGLWMPGIPSCEPNPCYGPVPVRPSSWGRIKQMYR